jgi:hypothetical protein
VITVAAQKLIWHVLSLVNPVSKRDTVPESKQWGELDKQLRDQCERATPLKGGTVVFPSSQSHGFFETSPPERLPAEIDLKSQLIVAYGCITYRSFDETHHTGFCQFATNVRTAPKWEFLNCPVANFAD